MRSWKEKNDVIIIPRNKRKKTKSKTKNQLLSLLTEYNIAYWLKYLNMEIISRKIVHSNFIPYIGKLHHWKTIWFYDTQHVHMNKNIGGYCYVKHEKTIKNFN